MLSSGSALPLLAGAWVPIFILISILYEVITGNWIQIPEIFNILLIGLTAIGLMGLGFQLQAEAGTRPAPSPAV
jgi:hypothetical protein